MKTKHKLVLGDCVKKRKEITNEGIDLIVTDPPFNIGKKYGKYKDRLKKKNISNGVKNG